MTDVLTMLKIILDGDGETLVDRAIIESARAEITRLRAQEHRGDDGWRDISTAPKGLNDRILLYSDKEADDTTPQIGVWRNCQWVVAWDFTPMDGSAFAKPTHWQPLPAPPGVSPVPSQSQEANSKLVDETIERCAKVARDHRNRPPAKIRPGLTQSDDDFELMRESIRSEERGEKIASEMIELAIRALKSQGDGNGL